MARPSRRSIVSTASTTAAAPEHRHRMIATAAYYRAASRAFQAGDMLADWLEAEAEIDRILKQPPLSRQAPKKRRSARGKERI